MRNKRSKNVRGNQQEARNSPIVGLCDNKMIYSNNMRTNRNELMRRLLSGITTSELQNLVRMREEARPIPTVKGREERPIPAPRRRTPIPTPRRNVRQLVQCFEANPIPSYRPIPAPRKKRNNNQYQPLGRRVMKKEWL